MRLLGCRSGPRCPFGTPGTPSLNRGLFHSSGKWRSATWKCTQCRLRVSTDEGTSICGRWVLANGLRLVVTESCRGRYVQFHAPRPNYLLVFSCDSHECRLLNVYSDSVKVYVIPAQTATQGLTLASTPTPSSLSGVRRSGARAGRGRLGIIARRHRARSEARMGQEAGISSAPVTPCFADMCTGKIGTETGGPSVLLNPRYVE